MISRVTALSLHITASYSKSQEGACYRKTPTAIIYSTILHNRDINMFLTVSGSMFGKKGKHIFHSINKPEKQS